VILREPQGTRASADASPEASPTAAGQEICFACGFCCDGTLYPNVGILPQDSEQFLVGLGLIPSKGAAGQTVGFSQPCPQFTGKCAIYERGRPFACATYRCRLLRSVDAGTHTTGEALRIVGEAKALKASLPAETDAMMAEANPDYEGGTAVSRAMFLEPLLNDPAAGAFREKYGEDARAVVRFARFLNAHFLPGH
jgi:hypothetical protein